MAEKLTGVSEDVHSFIHLFTKRSQGSYGNATCPDTERSPRQLWGCREEAARRARQLPLGPDQPVAVPGVSGDRLLFGSLFKRTELSPCIGPVLRLCV